MFTDVTDCLSQVIASKSAIQFSSRRGIDIAVAAARVAGQPFTAEDEDPPSLEKGPPLPRSADLNLDVNAKDVYNTSITLHCFLLHRKPGQIRRSESVL